MFMSLKENCTIETMLTDDGNGNKTYDSESKVSVKCEYHENSEMNDEGSVIITSAWAILEKKAVINFNSKITLPSGSQLPIKTIKGIKNFRTKEIEGFKVEFKGSKDE